MSPSCADFAVKIWDSTSGHICDLPNLFGFPSIPKEVLLIDYSLRLRREEYLQILPQNQIVLLILQ